jgi:hypothetical protein
MKALSRAGIAVGAALIAVTAVPAASAHAEDRGKCYSRAGWGEVCLKVDEHGYSVSAYTYWRSGAANEFQDFHLNCENGRWFGDMGAFSLARFKWQSYTFAVGKQGTCWGVLINQKTGYELETPPVHNDL